MKLTSTKHLPIHSQFGYANISLDCAPCNCNKSGSIETFCDTHTGQCPCKIDVEGLQCDICVDGFFGLSNDGCQGKKYTIFNIFLYFLLFGLNMNRGVVVATKFDLIFLKNI